MKSFRYKDAGLIITPAPFMPNAWREGTMNRVAKFTVVILVCWAAALTVGYGVYSGAWQHVRWGIHRLPWPSLEVANFFMGAADVLMVAIVSGAFTLALAMWARLPAVLAATALSVAVFFSMPEVWPDVLNGYMDAFDVGHAVLTVEFFLGGWLIASLVLRFRRRPGTNGRTTG
jgi:hypothetical protein